MKVNTTRERKYSLGKVEFTTPPPCHVKISTHFRAWLVAAILLVAGVGTAVAQTSNVTGTVTSSAGGPMPGVMVIVDGTQTVSMTDVQGRYAIEVPSAEAVLQFTLAGYTTVARTVGTQSVIDVVMSEDVQSIDQVVVTALGILRKEKSLTYATQIVDGDELSRVKDANMMNSLAGKTSGVQINRSAAGVGGSAKVIIRGSRSVSGVGGPLYVIDGVPVGGTGAGGTNTGSSFGAWQGGHDTGDAMSQLNPEDIESMNILKGPSAAALYGTSAANGVILITTKKGSVGRMNISFSTNTTFENAVYGRPEFQDSYGGASTSWGDKINKKADYLKDFFQTGVTTINSLTMSGGNDRAQSYFSYANTYSKGVFPGSKFNKHNLNFRETASFIGDRLKLDANVNLIYEQRKNLISPGGYYMSPLTGLYRFPRGGGIDGGQSWEYYRDNYELYNKVRNFKTQNWYKSGDLTEQNPFWILNRAPGDVRNYRTLLNLAASFKINDYLTLQARGKADFSAGWDEKRLYASTEPGLTAEKNGDNGYYGTGQNFSLGLYGDLLLTYQQNFGEDWSVNATLGASIADGHGRSQNINSAAGGLDFANAFRVENIVAPLRPSVGKWRSAQEQALFFAGQVGWREQLFLDVTARNDWSATLAYTPKMKSGFFYPSVGLSWLINESVTMPEWVSLGKVRATWAQVGNGIPGGSSNPMWGIGFGPEMQTATDEPNTNLQPEMTTSVELGTEWRLFNSRLEFDLTYYQTHSRNQAFRVEIPTGQSENYTHRWVNAGDIKNEGFEVTLAGTPIRNNEFSWRTGVNFATNKNTVVSLYNGDPSQGIEPMEYLQVGETNEGNGFNMRLYPGGSFGDIYGYAFERGTPTYDKDDVKKENPIYPHEGPIAYDEKTGLPLAADKGYYRKLGNSNPDFTLGWNNTFTWKGISLYMLIDGRFGGEVVSMTQADMDLWGVSKRTGKDRDRGYVEFDGRKIDKIVDFYNLVGGRGGVTEHYVYDATNIRMRELSIGYSIPRRWLEKTGWIKGADVSLIGRNLFFIMNNAPYDPDALMSTGMGLQGVDVYGPPTARSIGFSVKLNF